MLCPCAGQQHLASCFDAPCLLLSLLNITLRVVIHPEAHESKCDTEALNRMDGLVEPDDSDADDSHPLEQRCDGVSDRGCRR